MKRTWDIAELEEHWTLSTDECQAALDNKIEANRLRFALLVDKLKVVGLGTNFTREFLSYSITLLELKAR